MKFILPAVQYSLAIAGLVRDRLPEDPMRNPVQSWFDEIVLLRVDAAWALFIPARVGVSSRALQEDAPQGGAP